MTDSAPELNKDSLTLPESVVMGIAGTAPAYSIAATTTLLVSAVGLSSIASLFYCGLILFGITLSFLHLNRMKTNAGGSYAWVGEVFHPTLGFLAGWSLLVASAVFMVSGTIPAAVATLALLNPSSMNHPPTIVVTAAGWLLFVGFIVLKGIRLSSYFQVFLTLLEVALLLLIIAATFLKFSSSPVTPFSWEQLSLFGFTPESFSAGALTALFFFWGWDVTVNLSEETKNAAYNPGRGAIWAMSLVLILFLSFILSAQFALSPKEIEKAGSNIIMVIAEKVFNSPWSYAAIAAVMLSTIGTLETTILQFSRTLFATSRDGVLDPRYATLHPKWKTPWRATLLIIFIGLILLFASSFIPRVDQIITLSVKAICFQIAFYYGLTAFACAWYYGKKGQKAWKERLLLILWPLLSAFFMLFIFIYCIVAFDPLTSCLGIGGILSGIIPLYLKSRRKGTL